MSALLPAGLLPAFLVLFFTAPRASAAEPLLLLGKTDAHLAGAFSYDFLQSPLDYPAETAEARLRFNVPVGLSAPLHRYLGESSESLLVVPRFFAGISQKLNANIEIASPVPGGTAFFAWRENAGLSVTGSMGDTRFHLDTTLADKGSLLLVGSLHFPLRFSAYWRSLTFGYRFGGGGKEGLLPAVGFQLHKHLLGLRLDGDLRTDMTGLVRVESGEAQSLFRVDYGDEKLSGRAEGHYEAEGWSPEMSVGLGRFGFTARMGFAATARGGMETRYRVPYFIDADDFSLRYAEPDSFLSAEGVQSLLNAEVNEKTYRMGRRLAVRFPPSYSFSFEPWKGHLTLSYSRTLGKATVKALADGPPKESPGGEGRIAAEGGGSAGTDGGAAGAGTGGGSAGEESEAAGEGSAEETSEIGTYLDIGLAPDHVMVLAFRFGAFSGHVGAFAFNLDYRREEKLLSGLSALALGEDPLAPILDFGFSFGRTLRLQVDLLLLPLPALRGGVTYGFL